MEAIYEITLDLHSTVSQASLAVKQGDTNRKIYIPLREGGKPYHIERGTFAVFSTITPTGKVIEGGCTIEGNKIVYGFDEALTASSGIMDVEIRIYDVNKKTIITPAFTLIVDPRAAVGEVIKEATNSFTSLDAMYNKLNGIANEVQTKLDNGEFVGERGASAGFGEVTAEAVPRSPGTPPTVSVKTSGPDTAKNVSFAFGIPTPSDLDFEVDPDFSKNSWETIAKVARFGDPSKYWKVGDYKMVKMPKPNEVYDVYPFDLVWDYYGKAVEVYDKELFLSLVGNREGVYSVGHTTEGYYWIEGVTDKLEDVGVRGALGESEYARVAVIKSTITGEPFSITTLGDNSPADYKVTVTDAQKFLSTINYVPGAYYAFRDEVVGNIEEILKNEKSEIVADKVLDGKGFAQIGLSIPNHYYQGETIIVVKAAQDEEMVYTEVPLQIIGFNHDKVTDPYNYGKQKAGLTLQLGVSRNIYGDTEASLPIIPIDGLLTSNGYYKAPNDVKEDFSNGATNWADSGFRKAIQSIFDNTEIEPYIVNVQKLTSKYYKSSLYWSDTLLTEDKVFLPSEYEMFGDQIVAPFKEGEQYELYEDGYSKFMWSQGLLDSPAGTVIRLWLRSGYGKKVNEIKEDSNYSCNVYLSVNSFEPLSVVYSPSYANGGNGMIAPCICL